MTDARDLVRRESRPVDGPAELDLAVDVGRVEVHLEEARPDGNGPDGTAGGGATPGDAGSESAGSDGAGGGGAGSDAAGSDAAGRRVRVEVRHDPTAAGGWAQRIGEVASWLGAAASDSPGSPGSGADAVRAAEVVWTEPDGGSTGLVVRSGTEMPLRMVPLVVTVWAPVGSRVTARTGAGDVTVHGRAGRTTVRTGAGSARTGDVSGDAEVTTGSGDVALGAVAGRARIRTGSGAVRMAAVGGTTDIKAGSGDVTVGEVAADVGVRTGTGAVHVADARAGRVELTTGSGGLRIGIHAGVLAELDLSSGSGRARSELEVRNTAPPGEPGLRLRGRTASGDVLVARAATPA